MRDLLQRIRIRVDRLAAGEAFRTCDGQHAVVKVSYVPLWRIRARLAARQRAGLLRLRRRARVPPPRDAATARLTDPSTMKTHQPQERTA